MFRFIPHSISNCASSLGGDKKNAAAVDRLAVHFELGRFAICCAMVALIFCCAGRAFADGMIYQLPKDGAWVTYAFAASAKTTGAAADDTMNFKGLMTIASVGQTVVQGELCRWIEIHMGMDAKTAGEQRGETYKVLVPEKYLTKGESPLKHVVQAWMQRGATRPEKMLDPSDINIGPLPIILSGPWTNPQPTEKIAIDTKLGKLDCAGTQGTLDFKMGTIGNMLCRLENRVNESSPFGVVTCSWSLQLPDIEGKRAMIFWDLRLVDVGVNAVSKLPDIK
jgi:hypothetical protein